jgi:hypothetical protein
MDGGNAMNIVLEEGSNAISFDDVSRDFGNDTGMDGGAYY